MLQSLSSSSRCSFFRFISRNNSLSFRVVMRYGPMCSRVFVLCGFLFFRPLFAVVSIVVDLFQVLQQSLAQQSLQSLQQQTASIDRYARDFAANRSVCLFHTDHSLLYWMIRRIYVGSLQYELTEEHVKIPFSQWGTITSIDMPRVCMCVSSSSRVLMLLTHSFCYMCI